MGGTQYGDGCIFFKIDTFEQNRYQIDTKFWKKYLLDTKYLNRYQTMNLADSVNYLIIFVTFWSLIPLSFFVSSVPWIEC